MLFGCSAFNLVRRLVSIKVAPHLIFSKASFSSRLPYTSSEMMEVKPESDGSKPLDANKPDHIPADAAISDANSENVCQEEKNINQNLKRPLDEATDDLIAEQIKKQKGGKKKKFVMLMGYCGQGYLGMQYNHGFKTIEGDLFDVFMKLGIMDEESYKIPQVIHFQRAARTDKGVSAIRQVVSFKMENNGEDHVSLINSQLPECIRVFATKKVTAGFSSKNSCDGRCYAYVLPTFAFAPIDTLITRDYRISEGTLAEANNVLGLYKGTHNFHNFTSKLSPADPSSKRYVTHCSCSKPFLVKDMEFVKISVKGQSFVLHQIRKMIGLAIAILRGYTNKDTIETCFSMERIDIPIAPSLNLLLEEPLFDSYNRRYGSDGMHEPLVWDAYDSQVDQFCKDHIFPVIHNGEMEENSMMNWLSTLSNHTYSVRGPRPSQSSEDVVQNQTDDPTVVNENVAKDTS